MGNEDTCVMCGRVIPEGSHVCKICLKNVNAVTPAKLKQTGGLLCSFLNKFMKFFRKDGGVN